MIRFFSAISSDDDWMEISGNLFLWRISGLRRFFRDTPCLSLFTKKHTLKSFTRRLQALRKFSLRTWSFFLLLFPHKNPTHPKHGRSAQVHAGRFRNRQKSPGKDKPCLDSLQPKRPDDRIHELESRKKEKENDEDVMEHHQLVRQRYPHLLEECEGGDLTTERADADDARGTLRPPRVLRPPCFLKKKSCTGPKMRRPASGIRNIHI